MDSRPKREGNHKQTYSSKHDDTLGTSGQAVRRVSVTMWRMRCHRIIELVEGKQLRANS
jgi:hypothetical protein